LFIVREVIEREFGLGVTDLVARSLGELRGLIFRDQGRRFEPIVL
jgi:hypothetical protein